MLRSVTKPIKALVLTFVLFFVIQFWFAIWGFTMFRGHYESPDDDISGECNELGKCFWTTVDQGFKNDGGLGGGLTAISNSDSVYYWDRLAFDNAYNILLCTVLLNIVFGIIIDTFADLRVETQEKTSDMNGVCFICSIGRNEFDRHARGGFETHIKKEHNMWAYLYLCLLYTSPSPRDS